MSNTATNTKHHECPNCNEDLSIPEYNAQECWSCGWPDNMQEDEDDNETSPALTKYARTASEMQKK